jgi:ABC-type amino acid transport substrate-binding protein
MRMKLMHCTLLQFLIFCVVVLTAFTHAIAGDLLEIKEKGVLRHLGIPYANFITGSGDGLDADLIRLFAAHLGVQYQYIPTTWENWTEDLTGKKYEVTGNEVKIVGTSEIRGDLIASGLTVLPWRQQLVDFSMPTFPTQVWLITRGDLAVDPIRPSQDIGQDIVAVKSLFEEGKVQEVMGKKATCLDPALYGLKNIRTRIKIVDFNLNELAPALINGEAESTLLDGPDALIALEKWTGQIKVIGPVSEQQSMSVGFPKSSPKLREAFNVFLHQCKEDGTYYRLIMKYYPNARAYFPAFFDEITPEKINP